MILILEKYDKYYFRDQFPFFLYKLTFLLQNISKIEEWVFD